MALLPTLTKMVDTLTNKVIPKIKDLIKWWNNLSDGTKKFIKVIGGILVAIGPVLTVIGKIGGAVSSVKKAFDATNQRHP